MPKDREPITEEMLVDFLIDHEIESAEELDTFSAIIHLLMLEPNVPLAVMNWFPSVLHATVFKHSVCIDQRGSAVLPMESHKSLIYIAICMDPGSPLGLSKCMIYIGNP